MKHAVTGPLCGWVPWGHPESMPPQHTAWIIVDGVETFPECDQLRGSILKLAGEDGAEIKGNSAKTKTEHRRFYCLPAGTDPWPRS